MVSWVAPAQGSALVNPPCRRTGNEDLSRGSVPAATSKLSADTSTYAKILSLGNIQPLDFEKMGRNEAKKLTLALERRTGSRGDLCTGVGSLRYEASHAHTQLKGHQMPSVSVVCF